VAAGIPRVLKTGPDPGSLGNMAELLQYRRAGAGDYQEIQQLQSANYIANLTEEERRSGFLSAQFSLEETAQIAEDLGITVAVLDHRVAGFLCAFRNEFPSDSPVIAEMLRHYPLFRFEDRPLSRFFSYIYGPVCIARQYRGRGLLRGLYEAQKKDLAGRFEVGVAFVSRSNPHSLRAHVNGLGMMELGDFQVAANRYVALAFRLPSQ
jgi:predicted GNAT superfamily acetyltransferase